MAVIKVKPYGEGQGEYVNMEEESFVEGFHELYVGGGEENTEMTAAQIKEKLTAAGIEFKSNTSKAGLLELLNAVK